MRVMIISAVYPPEPVVSAQTSAQLAQALAARGYAVTVLTPLPSKPAGKLFPGYRRRLFQKAPGKLGIQLVYCFSFFSSESRLLSRLLENLSFGLSSALAFLFAPRPDVAYLNTWPLLAAGLLALAARLRGVPLVLSVQDVYPESLLTQGRAAPANRWIGLLRGLDGWIARSSAAVITISERFASLYREGRGVPAAKVHCVPNWIDEQAIDLQVSREGFRREHDISEDAFLAVYGGNVGVAAGVEALVEAFMLLDETPRAHLLVAGEGSRLERCRALASQAAAGRVSFFAPWPAGATSATYLSADLLLLPTQGDQSLVSLPSKLLYCMLAGRPVLALAQPGSDLAEVIEQAGCGWCTAPGESARLAQLVRQAMALSPQERERMGQAGRVYVLQNFSAGVCLPRLVNICEEAMR